LGPALGDDHFRRVDLIRIRVRQWLDENGVGEAEHRGVRADAERERQNDDRGKRRVLANIRHEYRRSRTKTSSHWMPFMR
jgi:hypothetical protein